MSEREPYEDIIKGRLNELPIPDENEAWQKMKLLLNDDDDRIPPPIFFRSCVGWGLLLLTGVLIAWLLFHPEKQLLSRKADVSEQSRKRNPITQITTQHRGDKNVSGENNHKHADEISTTAASSQNVSSISKPVQETNNTRTNQTIGNDVIQESIQSNPKKNNTIKASGVPRSRSNKRATGGIISSAATASFALQHESRKRSAGLDPKKRSTTKDLSLQTTTADLHKTIQSPEKNAGKDSGNINPGNFHKDTIHVYDKKKIDSPVVKKPAVDSIATAATPPLKRNYFSIGIGLQQQLPIAGQQSSPYNYYGRKGSLADYFPSIYLRYHKQEKWLLHLEFRYGAPQNVKEVAYVNETSTKFDSTGGTVTSFTTTNISTLQKTFYHQVPISFDYFIRPGWSIGGGFMYSRFFSAVSENESHLRNNITQVESVNKKIVQTDTDADSSSFFTKSQVQLILNTEYTWKRLSGGIRYAKGLQPFIRYTTSTGEVNAQKNQSVNVFIRFRLWKEDNKMKK
jgi:hypothetical protein